MDGSFPSGVSRADGAPVRSRPCGGGVCLCWGTIGVGRDILGVVGAMIYQLLPSDWAWLWAIAQVESRGNDSMIGRRGERGRWQFRLATWRQHTRWPFASAHEYDRARVVAQKHWCWLQSQLGLASSYLVARAWREGCEAVRRVPRRRSRYASRISRLALQKVLHGAGSRSGWGCVGLEKRMFYET